MIKFSQFVRASVMALAVGFGGMAAASPALAHSYSSADLADAQYNVDVFQYIVNDEQAIVADYQHYLDYEIEEIYNSWVFECQRSFWQGENYRLECLRDAFDWKEAEVPLTVDNISYHSTFLSDRQADLEAAIMWRNTVQADCCSDL